MLHKHYVIILLTTLIRMVCSHFLSFNIPALLMTMSIPLSTVTAFLNCSANKCVNLRIYLVVAKFSFYFFEVSQIS